MQHVRITTLNAMCVRKECHSACVCAGNGTAHVHIMNLGAAHLVMGMVLFYLTIFPEGTAKVLKL